MTRGWIPTGGKVFRVLHGWSLWTNPSLVDRSERFELPEMHDRWVKNKSREADTLHCGRRTNR
jgi:hypothetical protein